MDRRTLTGVATASQSKMGIRKELSNLRQVYIFLHPHPALKKVLEKAQLDPASLTLDSSNKHFSVQKENEEPYPMLGI